jgi:hypothetical protein
LNGIGIAGSLVVARTEAMLNAKAAHFDGRIFASPRQTGHRFKPGVEADFERLTPPWAPVGRASPIHERSTRQHGEAIVAEIGIRVHRDRDRAVEFTRHRVNAENAWSEDDGGDETCGTGPYRS